MANSEFDLIERYFEQHAVQRRDVILGIGDDCALLRVTSGQTLAVSMDLLVAGVHFEATADARSIGHKALAVNLSDLAAQGASPAWVMLGLALPQIDHAWLQGFCDGFLQLGQRFGVQLIGGDTTRGPLTIAVQVHGLLSSTQGLRRDGARPGDRIFVTGTLGDAGHALTLHHCDRRESRDEKYDQAAHCLRRRLDYPEPRVAAGISLLDIASAAIDVSDGLAQDLGHLLKRSSVGACLAVEKIPQSDALRQCASQHAAILAALTGGDDYELCFTVPPQHLHRLAKISAAWNCACTEIGIIESGSELRCINADGSRFVLERPGYDHFS